MVLEAKCSTRGVAVAPRLSVCIIIVLEAKCTRSLLTLIRSLLTLIGTGGKVLSMAGALYGKRDLH